MVIGQEVNNSATGAVSIGRVRLIFWCAVFILGLLQVWAHRNDMVPDGISYLEMAQAGASVGWKAFINGYWSPLYPTLLSIVFRSFHPSAYWQFTVVHVVNLLIYLVSFGCFEIFLRELTSTRLGENERIADLSTVGPNSASSAKDSRTWWMWGCLFFLWASQHWLNLAMVTPDLCVAACVYLATASLLKIYRGQADAKIFAGLGLVLGVAYLAKAAMLPLGFVFLACAFWLARPSGKAAKRALLSALVFLAVAAPLVVALSLSKGRVTFGDSGRIAYAEYVDGVSLNTHWQGEPSGSGIPAHATRRILNDPPVYEFATPIGGSYPPWYDPSYWYEGVVGRFTWRGQLWNLFRTMNAYLRMISRGGVLYVAFVGLLALKKQQESVGRVKENSRMMWAPAVAALAMFALVHVEPRYVGAFALTLLMGIFTSVRVSETGARASAKRAVLAIFLAPALGVAWMAAKDLKEVVIPKPFEEWQAALGIYEMGVLRGSHVGYIGSGGEAYWAHLAGVRVTAELPRSGVESFLAAGDLKKEAVWQAFAKAGVQAVVSKDAVVVSQSGEWRRVGNTPYYMHPIFGGLKNYGQDPSAISTASVGRRNFALGEN